MSVSSVAHKKLLIYNDQLESEPKHGRGVWLSEHAIDDHGEGTGRDGLTSQHGFPQLPGEPAVTGTRPQASTGVAEIRCYKGNRWIGKGLTEQPNPHGLLEMNSGSASAERRKQPVR
jgi:hypothetical protein